MAEKEEDAFLGQKEEMAELMRKTLDDATDPWGIRVEMIEVKDVFQKSRQKTILQT